jgi:putative ABC transport system permease protein
MQRSAAARALAGMALRGRLRLGAVYRVGMSDFSDSMPAAASLPPLSPPPRPRLWALAWRQMGLDFRAGELRLVLVAVVLAVAALTAVGFFADRLQGGLTRDAAQLLGGDLVVLSDHELPVDFETQARAAGLQTASNIIFPSMARAPAEKGEATRLVSVKAVSPSYPVRGHLTLRRSANGNPAQDDTQGVGPPPGSVFIESALTEALGVTVGDSLLLGDASLRIAALIVTEPDRGTGFLGFAPRVIVADADLSATGLVQPGSRLNYRFLIAAAPGREAAVSAFGDWARARIKAGDLRGVRLESLESGRPEMRQTLDRANKFLNLVALLAALLAAVAVAIAAQDFASRHLDDCAMLRVLGLSQRQIAGIYGLEFAALERRGRALRLVVALGLRGPAWQSGAFRAAAAERLAGALRHGGGAHAAARLRPAAGAAAGASAAAAGHPP